MKKAFTLVELLAVIVIIGVIALITTPIIIDSINTSKTKTCEKQKKEIERAAERWGNDNVVELNGLTEIPIDTLKKEGYLEAKQILNPKDKKELTGSIKISKETGQYKYTYNLEC